MNKKRMVKIGLGIFNVIIIALLVLSIIYYEILDAEVGRIIAIWGITAMIIFVIILEGAPVFVGPSVAVATLIAMGKFSPWFILSLFLISAIIGNIVYYYLGYFSGEKILKYFNRKDVNKYKKTFNKHGKMAMAVMAISPIPYIPTIAGVFKMKKSQMFIQSMGIRLIRHTIVFFIWYFALKGF